MSVLFAVAFAAAVSDKPYVPDIKLGIIKQAKKCVNVVTKDSLIYCHITAKVQGQALPIVDTKKTGKTIYFRMNSQQVIPGIRKGLVGACQGETRRITIPPNLAYGGKYVDGLFPPDATWIADIEIVDVIDSSEY